MRSCIRSGDDHVCLVVFVCIYTYMCVYVHMHVIMYARICHALFLNVIRKMILLSMIGN
jgi:hypothetical protein